jgi:predicted metalloendopeptidase
MLKHLGRTNDDAAEIVAFETKLAHVFMRKEDTHDADKTYNKRTLTELRNLAPSIDWKRYFSNIGVKEQTTFILMQPDTLAAVTKLIEKTPLETLRSYIAWNILNDFAGALSLKLKKESFEFYGTVLFGAKKMKPLWRQGVNGVNGSLGEVVGRLYVAKHFPPEAKREMNRMVDDLFETYAARITAVTWMGPTTKKKALVKLAATNRKIGYPNKWKSYNGLSIRADDFVGNIIRSARYEHARTMRKLKKGLVDFTEWYFPPQIVNAFYCPTMNDMLFPAGILQPPYFTPGGDEAVNYGAIGTVIGHEMTHGFDDQGSKFDAKGSLKNWWTPEDKKRFIAKTKVLQRQFDRYEVADGVKVNGELTLGENIADLGGMLIAYEALQRRLKITGRKLLGGLTPEQRFFLGFAIFERQNIRPEYEKTVTIIDVHAPGQFRINGPASNLIEFYEAYGVKKGDQLYREPKDRAQIW